MNLRKHLHLGLGLSFCSVLVLPACGDSGSAETGAGPTTAGSDTGSSTASSGAATGTTADSNPTTGPTGGSGGQTDSGTTTGTGATTSTSTGPGTGDPGTTADTGGSTSGTGGTTGGGDEFVPCVTDEDCALVDDCCECEPVNVNEAPHVCDLPECLIPTCAGHGLEGAAVECRFGRCTFAKVQCNPLGITCDTSAPECPGDQVPGVMDTDDGKCWTGFCVPAEACDWVLNCDFCADEELVCVGKLQKGAYHVCEPRPADCEGTGNIDCGCGQQICDASPPHTVCHDEMPDIACECPFC